MQPLSLLLFTEAASLYPVRHIPEYTKPGEIESDVVLIPKETKSKSIRR
jgi:hypothetical protein